MIDVFQWGDLRRALDGRLILLYRHQRIFDEGLIRPGIDVLDIGGWGVLAQAAIEAGARCTILDLFTEDQYYPDRVRALPHKVGDARDHGHFCEAAFDTVTCFEMLEHCGGISEVVANAFLWLRPGGFFVGTIPIPGRIHRADEPGIDFLTREEISTKLEQVGLRIERVEPTGSINEGDSPVSLYFVGRKPVV